MIEVEPCARCGHDKHEHRPVALEPHPRFVSRDGSMSVTMVFGQCAHAKVTPHLSLSCSCRGYVPSRFPRLTVLLGHDVVSAAA